jgi:hypothetical protein
MEIKVRRNLQFALLPYLKMNPLGQAHVGRRRVSYFILMHRRESEKIQQSKKS